MMILTGIFSAFLTLFLNYCIGKPASEFSPYEIFSRYTVWLSIKKLQRIGLYQQYINQYNENLKRMNSKHEIFSLNKDFEKMLYNAAEPFFTWERMVGMCPVCTGFWVSLITGLCFTQSFISLSVIVLTSHISIRLLNKVL